MANSAHLALLKTGVKSWNSWRAANPCIAPDLENADLEGINLQGFNLILANCTNANLNNADLSNANLASSNLTGASLVRAILSNAKLSQTRLIEADLSHATCDRAMLNEAVLIEATLYNTTFRHARLMNANLCGAILIGTNFKQANISGCSVRGMFAFGVKLKGTTQSNLVIHQLKKQRIIVDRFELSQLMHLLIWEDSTSLELEFPSNIALILGDFRGRRRHFFFHIQEKLRDRKLIPLLFEYNAAFNLQDTALPTLLKIAQVIVFDISHVESLHRWLEEIQPAPPVQILAQTQSGGRKPGKGRIRSSRHLPICRYRNFDEMCLNLQDSPILTEDETEEASETCHQAK